MRVLETSRLIVRPFVPDDADCIHRILDIELSDADFGNQGPTPLAQRRDWVHWTIASYEQLAQLNQPPYGERAIVLKRTNELIGACGFVPCLAPFAQLPSWNAAAARQQLFTTEFGLYYAVSPAHQRCGYATEAIRAMIDYAFRALHLQRLVATTTHDNAASMGVMRKVGMRIDKNPQPDPPWFQVVGILEAD